MDFLPIRIHGAHVYAGFWKRFCAGIVDAIILMPLGFFFAWLQGFDRMLAIGIVVPSSVLFAMYNVWFNARFGGTLGKLVVGIRIAKPNGTRIGWPEAWKRSAVDLAFAIVFLVFTVWALLQVDPEQYSSLGFMDRGRLLGTYQPAWFTNGFIMLPEVWTWSELLVLLLNQRRRAIHDFIAGTVVVMKEFTESHTMPRTVAEIHAVDLP